MINLHKTVATNSRPCSHSLWRYSVSPTYSPDSPEPTTPSSFLDSLSTKLRLQLLALETSNGSSFLAKPGMTAVSS